MRNREAYTMVLLLMVLTNMYIHSRPLYDRARRGSAQQVHRAGVLEVGVATWAPTDNVRDEPRVHAG